MSLEDCYIQTQLDFLEITLALAGEIPKRSGDFETTYKNESGKEIVVKRSPDGKFANKNASAGAVPESTASTSSVGKSFAKSISDVADKLAKLPAKVQDAVRKAMFDSEFSRVIDKEAEKLIKSAYDPGLAIGFQLGQSIKAELAKKPFSKFAETVEAKFAEFRKDLPQKSENLKNEIIRIAKDPNTSTTIAAGALLGLAGNFYIAAFFSAYKAAGVSLYLLKLPNASALAAEIAAEMPAIAGTEEAARALAATTLATVKALSAGIIVAELVMGTAFNAIGHVIQNTANQALMGRVKSNDAIETTALKNKILGQKENADALYQEVIAQSTKKDEALQKIVSGIQTLMSPTPVKSDDPSILPSQAAIDLANKETEVFMKNYRMRKQVLEETYASPEFKQLYDELLQTSRLELTAFFSKDPEKNPYPKRTHADITKDIEQLMTKIARESASKEQLLSAT